MRTKFAVISNGVRVNSLGFYNSPANAAKAAAKAAPKLISTKPIRLEVQRHVAS